MAPAIGMICGTSRRWPVSGTSRSPPPICTVGSRPGPFGGMPEVLAPAQIAQLPPHKVVAYTSRMPPEIGRADRAWKRADVRAALSHSLARTVTRDKAREADDAHRDIHEHDVAPVARQVIADQTAAERELEVVDIRDTEPDATEHTDPVERRRVPLPDEDARRVELARWADEAKQSDDRTAGQDRG